MNPGKDIPIIFNSFNRVTTLRGMVEDLRLLGYYNFHILDNGSTWPPLLNWYLQEENHINIQRMGRNFMQNALFDYQGGEFIKSFRGKHEWIVYTDPDLEFNGNTPDDFVEQIIALIKKHGYEKGGLALRIDDLPGSEWGEINKLWEEKWWLNEIEPNVYGTQLDTTFCVIRPESGINYKAIRVAGDFTCRHIPWYTDFDNLSEEEKYYLENSHEYSTYKRFYDSVKH